MPPMAVLDVAPPLWDSMWVGREASNSPLVDWRSEPRNQKVIWYYNKILEKWYLAKKEVCRLGKKIYYGSDTAENAGF